MSKTQVSISYQSEEDRLLLRARITPKDVRMWLTRRMAVHLLGSIDKIFDHLSGTAAQPADQRQAVSDFRRDAAVAGTDFKQKYEEGDLELYPEDGPFLVHKVNFTVTKAGKVVVTLSGKEQHTVKLNLGEQELHAVIHMIRMAGEKAQWALPASTAGKDRKAPGDSPSRLVN